MQEPDLNKMWRTWIKIDRGKGSIFKCFQDTIRRKLEPILQLRKRGEIDWFYFLFHSKPDDPTNQYFDVVFTTDRESLNDLLPEYCTTGEKISPMTSISGIDMSILNAEDIKKAWGIIGEQSEFMIDFVCSHNENNEIHPEQIAQFMHFFFNSLGYGGHCLFFPEAFGEKVIRI